MTASPGSPTATLLGVAVLAACAYPVSSADRTAPGVHGQSSRIRATPRLPAGAHVYHNVTLIDPATTRQVPDAWLAVADGRIAAIGTGQPPVTDPQRSHDLSRRFVLPGFVDAHAHITATGIQKVEVRDGAVTISSESDDRITQHNARIALARGVTTVRNPGGDPVANARYDSMVRSGAWLGPEAQHAGAVIQPPPFTGGMFAYPVTEAAWDAEAARQARLGMTYFKLYVGLSEQELAIGIRAAHRHGLKAIAHLDQVSWARAIELGIDGLEHALPTSPDLLEPELRPAYVASLGRDSTFMYRWFEHADYSGSLIQRVIARMAAQRIAANLTLVVNELVYNLDDLDRVLPAEQLRDLLPEVAAGTRAQLKASATGWTADDFARARAVFPKVLAFARLLHEAGVPMMIGTDGGGGTLYARELALHVAAGIPVWAVLRMATSDAASIMGIGDRVGRLAPGYEADLVILDGDPIVDIASASRVYGVVNNGRLLEATALRR